MVRYRIVCGILNQNVREKLLAEGDELTLEKATIMCRTHEVTQAQLKTFHGTKSIPIKQEIDAISRYPNRNSSRKKNRKPVAQRANHATSVVEHTPPPMSAQQRARHAPSAKSSTILHEFVKVRQ